MKIKPIKSGQPPEHFSAEEADDEVDMDSMDSFPASDPPSYTGTVAHTPEDPGQSLDQNAPAYSGSDISFVAKDPKQRIRPAAAPRQHPFQDGKSPVGKR